MNPKNREKRKLTALGYVYIVHAHNTDTHDTRIIGVYESEQTASERVEQLRECFVIRQNEIVTINPEEVWGWEE